MVCGDLKGAQVEALGRGQQFVAFGVHADTGKPYHWPLGESPLDVAIEDLPRIGEQACRELLAEIKPLLPSPAPRKRSAQSKGRAPATRRAPGPAGPVRNERGIVVDGRDGWLSTIAYHAVHDALAAGHRPNGRELTQAVWRRFEATADLGRPKACGERYRPHDAERKVQDKLRLLAEGRLPARDVIGIEAVYLAPTLSVEQAREKLDADLQAACDRFAAWHANPEGPCRRSASAPPSVLERA